MSARCTSSAVVFLDGDKIHTDCDLSPEFHLAHPQHSQRLADGQRVFWERDAQIVWA